MIDEKTADLRAFWRRHYKASQRMLARALYENHVRAKCLEIAKKTLDWYARHPPTTDSKAKDTLANIKARLAKLEANDD